MDLGSKILQLRKKTTFSRKTMRKTMRKTWSNKTNNFQLGT